MNQMSIKIKLGLNFAVLAILLLVGGFVTYHATTKLSNSLSVISGPVREITSSINDIIVGVKQQMLAVEKILGSNNANGAIEELSQSRESIQNAYSQAVSVGQINPESLEKLKTTLDKFNETSSTLITVREEYLDIRGKISKNVEDVNLILNEANSYLSTVLDNLAFDLEDGEYIESTEEYGFLSSIIKTRLALVNRVYYQDQYVKFPDNPQFKQMANTTKNNFQIYIQDLSHAITLQGLPVEASEFKGKSLTNVLRDLEKQSNVLIAEGESKSTQLVEYTNQYKEIVKEVIGITDTIKENSKQIIDTTQEEALSAEKDALIMIFSGMAIMLIMLAMIYIFSTMSIVKPINSVTLKMKDISEGEGDLTARLPTKGSQELSLLSQAFNSFVTKIEDVIINVSGSVNKLSASASDLTSVNDTGRNLIQNQENQTTQVSTAMEQMAVSVADVAQSAQYSMDHVAEAEKEVNAGREVVSETLESIEQLANRIESATDVINNLGKKADAVGSVLDVIKGISEQTNLLALNAAIEAARAGEQGRGFAVVADEVRTLASKSAEATDEIHDIIDSLQKESCLAITAMNESKEYANHTVENGAKADQSLESILESVNGIHGMSHQIATASNEQSSTAQHISKNVQEISMLATDIFTNSNGVHESIQELNELSRSLAELVNQFKTN